MRQNDSSNVGRDNIKYKRQISQKQAIERIFETQDGRFLLEYLGDLLLFDIGQFCDNSNAMSFREGRRSVLVNLLSLKDMNLLKYVEQVKGVQVSRLNEME